MANNISEKNLIYSLDERTELPYANSECIDYSDLNSYVNSPSLNNVYTQLTSNDNYIAHRLLSMKDQASGPVVIDQDDPSTEKDEQNDQIYEMENGTKFYYSMQDSAVRKKVDKSLKQTLANALASHHVINMFFSSPDSVLMSIEDSSGAATYVNSCKAIEQTGALSVDDDHLLVHEDRGTSSNVILLHACDGDSVYLDDVFVGAYRHTDTYDQIFKVTKEALANGTQKYRAELMHTADGKITCIAYRQFDSSLFFAVQSSSRSIVYRCSISDGVIAGGIYEVGSFDNAVCKMHFAVADDGTPRIMLVFNDGTIRWSSYGTTAMYSQLQKAKLSGEVNDYQLLRASQTSALIATTHGLQLQKASDSTTSQVIGLRENVPNIAFYNTSHTSMLVGYGNDVGTLCMLTCDANGLSSKSSTSMGAPVQNVQILNGTNVIATSKALKYYNGNSYAELLGPNSQHLSCTAAAQNLNNNAYVAGKDVDGPFFAVVGTQNDGHVQSDEVTGMSSTALTCEVDDDTYASFSSTALCSMTQFSSTECAIARGMLRPAGDASSVDCVALLEVHINDNGIAQCNLVRWVLADAYHGAVHAKDTIGIVYADEDGADNLEIYNVADGIVSLHSHFPYVFSQDAFGGLSACFVVDGLLVGNDDDTRAVVINAKQTESSTNNVLVYAMLDSAVISNLLTCDLGTSQNSIVQVGNDAYALSSNGIDSCLLAFTVGTTAIGEQMTYAPSALDELPSNNFTVLSDAISSLQRDWNGNIWMNTSYALSSISAFNDDMQGGASIAVGSSAFSGLPSARSQYMYLDSGAAVAWCTLPNSTLSCISGDISQQEFDVHDYGFNASVSYASKDAGAVRFPCLLSSEANGGVAPSLYTFAYRDPYDNTKASIVRWHNALPFSISKVISLNGMNDALLASERQDGTYLWLYSFDDDAIDEYGQFPGIDITFANGQYGSYYAFMYNQSRQALQAAVNILDPRRTLQFFSGSGIGEFVRKDNFKIDYAAPQEGAAAGAYKMFVSYGNGSSHKVEELSVHSIESNGLVFASTASTVGTAAINALMPVDSRKCVIGASDGIYSYQYSIADASTVDDHCYKVLDVQNGVKALQMFYDRSIPVYTATSGYALLSSSTGMWWNKYLDISANALDTAPIECYLQTDSYTLFAGKNTNGMYFTRYKYDIVDNSYQFTAASAMAVYNENKNAISTTVSAALSTHVDEMHGENSPISLLNKYMPTSFPLSGAQFTSSQHSSAGLTVQNDYIERILEGNELREEVKAYAESTAIAGGRIPLELKYIAKQWRSGIVELYIYLPTTRTFYIPHVKGLCKVDTGDVAVNNLKLAPEVAPNATHIKLSILSTYFKADTIFENTVKGNSLPLKIYKQPERASSEGPVANMYHSYIEPSVASSIDTSKTLFDYYMADYWCFGSDAQAIKIMLYSSEKNFLKKYKTIVYHSGNENWKQLELQTDYVEQRFLDDDGEKEIYWQIFTANNGMFLGWSTKPDPTQPDVDEHGDLVYAEGTKLKYSMIAQDVLHLYAAWIVYAFDNDDTTITINNEGEQTYTIAELTIDPSITFNNSNKSDLGNRLVVKFDEE